MPPVSYRCAVVCLLAVVSFACKPRSDASSDVKAAGASAPSGKIKFEYNVTFRTLDALGGRLGDDGCLEAANWLIEPKDKDLLAAINAINASDKVYETAFATLLDPHWTYATCMSEGRPAPRTDGVGLKTLNESVNAKGFGLTIIVVGGIGSMFTPEGPIAEARAEWAKAGLKDFKVEHVGLGDIVNLETAAAKFKTEWESLVTKDGEKRRYLIWAHDVSGNMALDLLATNQQLRDQTLALVTVGSPLGGIVSSMFAEKIKNQLGNVAGTVTGAVPAGVSSSIGKFTAAMAGMASLTPEARRSHLASQIKSADFKRKDDGFGTKTRVFHVASAIDPANLSPMPLASVKDGQLVAAMTTRSMEHALLVPFLSSLKDEPLGDGLVSLPNAVIPKDLLPPDIDPTLIALTTFDHFGLQLTKRVDDVEGRTPPYAKIVDAILEGIAPSYGGFVDAKSPDAPEYCMGTLKPSWMDDRWSCAGPCKWVCQSCEAEGPDPEEPCR